MNMLTKNVDDFMSNHVCKTDLHIVLIKHIFRK